MEKGNSVNNLRDNIECISMHIQDDCSKEIFSNRLAYSMTENPIYLEKICSLSHGYEKFISFLRDHKKEKKVLFGTGQWGEWIVDTYTSLSWDFCTDNVRNSSFRGIKYLSVTDLVKSYRDICFVITIKKQYMEIYDQLLNMGVSERDIFCFGQLEKEVEKGIYFDLPYLRAGNNEVFVDAGGYDGESSLAFNSWSSGRGSIYLFEPSELSLNIAKEKLKNLSNVTYIEKGLYSSSTVMGFSNNGTESKISNDGSNQIYVTTLDEYMDEIQPTFIKMDIEGAEYEALIGARKTIRKYKPKLAISIYHKPEDIVEIPELILSMNSDYKLWLRHYSMTWFDTVLYAI